jgi:hypothetical protein
MNTLVAWLVPPAGFITARIATAGHGGVLCRWRAVLASLVTTFFCLLHPSCGIASYTMPASTARRRQAVTVPGIAPAVTRLLIAKTFSRSCLHGFCKRLS